MPLALPLFKHTVGGAALPVWWIAPVEHQAFGRNWIAAQKLILH